ncbi:MAG: endolytic transglycosylase MltG [Gemmatimonadaceae bacterium]|nr:endolytic transglycosylase MltG [Gemmatimonadaceae bacterium]
MRSTRTNSFPVAIACATLLFGACGKPHGSPVRVIIPRGATFSQATDSLAKAQIVKWPTGFRLLARVGGKDRNIKPGTYLLKRGTAWSEVLSALNGGLGVVNSVTIPEGFTVRQIIPLLARRLELPIDSLNTAVRDTALRSRLDVPTQTLEGYLFPDTYAFPDGTRARDAITEMVKRFEREWKPEWDARLTELAMNRNDIITLASIIEKEARLPEERPVISAVYHNRLRKQMLLQADPTVQYALPAHTQRVLYRDLEVKSPYNTYQNPGLPPGPIASPGGPSIVAALFPANVAYLYFVAFPDGHHEFRTTFAEHEQAKKQSQAAAKPVSPKR